LKWLWGLLPLALVALFVVLAERSRIEGDLQRRAKEALVSVGIPWAKPSFSGRDAVLRGFSLQAIERKRAVATVLKTAGVRVVEDMTEVSVISPYKWQAWRKDNSLKLRGYAPSRDTGRSIVGMARANMPDMKVFNEMQIADGAPNARTWMGGIGFALKQLGRLKTGMATMYDTSLSLTGNSEDSSNYNTVITALGELPSGISLTGHSIKPPPASPYLWSATWDGDKVAVSGHVPSQKAREEVIALLKNSFPAADISDSTSMASGSPHSWLQSVTAVVRQLARTENGTAVITDSDLQLSGDTTDREVAESIHSDLGKSIASNFNSQTNLKWIPPVPVASPYIWRADYHANTLGISGNIPDEDMQKSVLAYVKNKFPKAHITDGLAIYRGEPDNLANVIKIAVDLLSDLERGSAFIWDNDVEIRGHAANADIAMSTGKALEDRLPSGFTGSARVSHELAGDMGMETQTFVASRKASASREDIYATGIIDDQLCQEYLDTVLTKHRIFFATASAEIGAKSLPVLRILATIVRRCPESHIEISGHTDNTGSKKFNKFLSIRRANAVMKFITTKGGVDEERLTSVGYGEEKPVATNDTPENRALNRRIEFIVKNTSDSTY
jgi:OOP family OmpA-OmpF porin